MKISLSGPAASPRRQQYLDYLASPEWAEKKQQLLNLMGNKCERCYATEHLDMHHKTYARLFNEPQSDLRILCRDCHTNEHAIWAARKVDADRRRNRARGRRDGWVS